MIATDRWNLLIDLHITTISEREPRKLSLYFHISHYPQHKCIDLRFLALNPLSFWGGCKWARSTTILTIRPSKYFLFLSYYWEKPISFCTRGRICYLSSLKMDVSKFHNHCIWQHIPSRNTSILAQTCHICMGQETRTLFAMALL